MAKELKSVRLKSKIVKALSKYQKKHNLDDFTEALEMAASKELIRSKCLKGEVVL